MRMTARPLPLGMAPQPPPVPEIEGYLKKLKRKTSNLSGSWNKRWFFVDHKRREFGYAKSKTPGAPRSTSLAIHASRGLELVAVLLECT